MTGPLFSCRAFCYVPDLKKNQQNALIKLTIKKITKYTSGANSYMFRQQRTISGNLFFFKNMETFEVRRG